MGHAANKARQAVKAAILRARGTPKLRIVRTDNHTQIPRKDRVRPRSANRKPQWICRPNGRHHNEPSSDKNTAVKLPKPEALRVLATLCEIQDGICSLCGRPVVNERGSIDHTDPLYLNGYDGPGNWTFAHRDCNIRKANDEPTGCEIIWLFAVNARLGEGPTRW